MKTAKTAIALLFAIASFGTAGCETLTEAIVGPDGIDHVRVSPLEAVVGVHATVKLQAGALGEDGFPTLGASAPRWRSSAPAVATVDDAGVVTARREGTATITATIDGHSGKATITVPKPPVEQRISVGMTHSCRVTRDGKAFCWGEGSWGQLGNGTTTSSAVPVAVTGDFRFASVSAGAHHTCGARTDGWVVCWGWGLGGQLGERYVCFWTCYPSTGPVLASRSHVFASVSAGSNANCALTSAGQAHCWGERFSPPYLSSGQPPVAVGGSERFSEISMAGGDPCALTRDGRAMCWSGLGTPAPVAEGHTFASISASATHTCALTDGGKAFCWGEGGSGQLGDGAGASSAAPVPVAGSLAFASIATGGSLERPKTCALTTDGRAFCWGGGELGSGSAQGSPTPVPVSGGHTFAFVSVGPGGTVCGVTAADEALCWGPGYGGIPIRVAGG